MQADDIARSDSGGFAVRTRSTPDYARIEFAHAGQELRDVDLLAGFLQSGIARAGDGITIGTVARDVTALIFDPERVDSGSIRADYSAAVPRRSEFAIFLTWRAESAAGRRAILGIVGRSLEEGGYSFDAPIEGELASAFLLSSEMILDENYLTLFPAPVASSGRSFAQLSVSGFRGFAEKRTLDLAQPDGRPGSGLTVLVGANNSGKSTFLEALHSIARGRNQTQLRFPQPRRHRDLDSVTLELIRNDGRSLQVRSSRPGSSQAEAAWLPEGLGPDKFDLHLTPSRRNFTPYFGDMGEVDRDWGFMENEPSRTQLRDRFVGRLHRVDRDPDARKQFDALLTRIVGYPLQWTIDEIATGQQFVKLIEPGGAWHTSEGLGDGLVSMLFIVDALYDSDAGCLIAIDEPELSLHPQLVRRLGRVLSEYSSNRQILVATHSPILFDWADVSNGARVARVYKQKGRSEIAQPSTSILGTIARLVEARNPSNPHIVGTVAREALFLEDGVTLTEGQDDVTYLARVLDDLGLPQINNVYGWGAGGVANVPALAQFFLELGFTRVAAILDDDSQPGTLAALTELQAMGPSVLVRQIPAPDIRYKPAVKPRAAVVGLLEPDRVHVRADLRTAATAVLRDVITHVSGESQES